MSSHSYLVRVHNEFGLGVIIGLSPANPSSAVVSKGLSSLSSAASASLKAASTTILSGAAASTASAAATAWGKEKPLQERFKEFEDWERMKEQKRRQQENFEGSKVEL